jgi:hypothetical protein
MCIYIKMSEKTGELSKNDNNQDTINKMIYIYYTSKQMRRYR